jgi:hypothetical protein
MLSGKQGGIMRHSMRGVAFSSLLLLLVICAPLRASSIFTFTDTDSNLFNVVGTLTAADNGDGTFTVVSASGFFNSDPILLIPGSGISPSGLFIFNNLLYPSGNPQLDVNGLLFVDTITGAEINIWGNGPYPPTFYSTYTGLNGGYPLADTGSVFTLSSPELPTWPLLVMGLILLIMGQRHSRFLKLTKPLN